MKTNINFWSYLALCFLEWEMFRKKFVDKLEIRIFFVFVYWRLWDRVTVHVRGSIASLVSEFVKKQLCIDITVITQLYLQLYITYQLHVSAISVLAIIRFDTIIRETI